MLFLITCVVQLFGYLHACPPDEIISPCDCRSILNSDVMACRELLNPDELVKPITAVAEKKSPIEILAILNSTLLYIPNSIFKGATFQKINFINSEVMSFSDTDIAFEGLENSLTELRAKRASYVTHWDWNQLRNLKALELIEVSDVELGSIGIRFPALKKLRFLGITNAHIRFIIKYAFANLTDLTVLNLKGNEITELNRNMFPEPAYNLVSIDLSENELSELPQNIFRNMPSLENVILDSNKFTTLDSKMFSWALQHLSELAMYDNKFECDCRIKWMIGGHVPLRFTGQCDSPESLKGKPLRILQYDEINC